MPYGLVPQNSITGQKQLAEKNFVAETKTSCKKGQERYFWYRPTVTQAICFATDFFLFFTL